MVGVVEERHLAIGNSGVGVGVCAATSLHLQLLPGQTNQPQCSPDDDNLQALFGCHGRSPGSRVKSPAPDTRQCSLPAATGRPGYGSASEEHRGVSGTTEGGTSREIRVSLGSTFDLEFGEKLESSRERESERTRYREKQA
ncbi:hypothetical protein AAG570_003356 [Ranatra chinensis]|uniref:Uncharacterized protein n=1 Tax=Ranatra chinensis TaxID=642074 RepID=A0ABD0YLG2_9HEMI